MNKSNVIQPSMTASSASMMELETARHLIVLVPELDLDAASVARKIRELAGALQACVTFIGLSKDSAHEPALRRQLVTLSAMMGNQHISVGWRVELGSNWLGVVKSEWRDGDVIACFAEQRAGLAGKPLSQILQSDLKATVYILPGSKQYPRRLGSNWISNTLAWVGCIGIILGFFWLQLKLTEFPGNVAYTTLLYISIVAEAGLIWVWNSLFN